MMELPVYSKKEIATYATVDDFDFVWASQYRWHLNRGGYVARSQRRGAESKPFRMYLHREILGLKHGYVDRMVDHKDGDPLNNLRENLRVVTAAQNCQNRKPRAGSSSRYSGVHWYSSKGKWRVSIMVDNKRTLVGYYDDEDEAGRAAEAYRREHAPYWSPRT